jgi:hypothetical protein
MRRNLVWIRCNKTRKGIMIATSARVSDAWVHRWTSGGSSAVVSSIASCARVSSCSGHGKVFLGISRRHGLRASDSFVMRNRLRLCWSWGVIIYLCKHSTKNRSHVGAYLCLNALLRLTFCLYTHQHIKPLPQSGFKSVFHPLQTDRISYERFEVI